MIIIKIYIYKPVIVRIIIITEILIYCSFIYIDYNTNFRCMYSAVLKYVGILLCLLLTVLIGSKGHDKKDTRLLKLAFFLTAVADLFMVILDFNTLGILVFCLVQITYIKRHRRTIRKKDKLTWLTLAIILVIIISRILTDSFNKGTNNISLSEVTLTLGSIYAIILSYSVYTGWKTVKGNFYPVYSKYLISIGITLFLLCDINVALSSIAQNLFIGSIEISAVSRFLVWIFYLPSQVLLALSGYSRK